MNMDLSNVRDKLAEASFFFDHLRQEQDKTTLQRQGDGFRYYFSAFLNACFSVLEYLEREAKAALKAGADVYLYLIDEGVLTVDDPRFQPLRDSGLKLFACAYGAQRLSVPRKDDKATYCGLVVLSNIVSACDRFVALN